MTRFAQVIIVVAKYSEFRDENEAASRGKAASHWNISGLNDKDRENCACDNSRLNDYNFARIL